MELTARVCTPIKFLHRHRSCKTLTRGPGGPVSMPILQKSSCLPTYGVKVASASPTSTHTKQLTKPAALHISQLPLWESAQARLASVLLKRRESAVTDTKELPELITKGACCQERRIKTSLRAVIGLCHTLVVMKVNDGSIGSHWIRILASKKA